MSITRDQAIALRTLIDKLIHCHGTKYEEAKFEVHRTNARLDAYIEELTDGAPEEGREVYIRRLLSNVPSWKEASNRCKSAFLSYMQDHDTAYSDNHIRLTWECFERGYYSDVAGPRERKIRKQLSSIPSWNESHSGTCQQKFLETLVWEDIDYNTNHLRLTWEWFERGWNCGIDAIWAQEKPT